MVPLYPAKDLSRSKQEPWHILQLFVLVISHKYKFIFIKTAKTAGTSIEVWLSQICGQNDIITPVEPIEKDHIPRNYNDLTVCNGPWISQNKDKRGLIFFNHISASKVKERLLPEIWATYYKFCFERNPWDKTLSHYYMNKFRKGGDLTLADYFERGKFCLNYPKYCDENKSPMMNYIGNYSSLHRDIKYLSKVLGLPLFEESNFPRAKGAYRPQNTDYRDILNNEQANKINHIFRTEINLMNYSF